MYIVYLGEGERRISLVCRTYVDAIKCMMECHKNNVPYKLFMEV